MKIIDKALLKTSHPTFSYMMKKALFAYHEPQHVKQHYFPEYFDVEQDTFSNKKFIHRCRRCGRSRYEVRYDELPAECPWERPNIEKIIKNEEEKFLELMKNGERFVPVFIEKQGLSAKTLAILHHTHGYDIEIASTLMDKEFSKEIKEGYDQKMQEHVKKSRNNKFKITKNRLNANEPF